MNDEQSNSVHESHFEACTCEGGPRSWNGWAECNECGGDVGDRSQQRRRPVPESREQECPTCKGSGRYWTGNSNFPCQRCDGSGVACIINFLRKQGRHFEADTIERGEHHD